jgi:predicted alpha/beta-fold hydrolase
MIRSALLTAVILTAASHTAASSCPTETYRNAEEDSYLQSRLEQTKFSGACMEAIVSDEGEFEDAWYRDLRIGTWEWLGIDRITIDSALAQIMVNDALHDSDHYNAENQLDTYGGKNRNGAWIKIWSSKARTANYLGQTAPDHLKKMYYLRAATLFNIASYPHLTDEPKATRAFRLANRAYRRAGEFFDVPMVELNIPVEGHQPVVAYLHLPSETSGSVPVVLITGGVDATVLEHFPFAEELNGRGIAALLFDAPGLGNSSHIPLTSDQTVIHRAVITYLENHAASLGIDATRIGAVGMSMGGNPATRLALDSDGSSPVKAVVNMCGATGSVFSYPLAAFAFGFPRMTIEAVASSLGMDHRTLIDAAPEAYIPLRNALQSFSLYEQGYLAKWFDEDETGYAGPGEITVEQAVRTEVPILSINTADDPIGSVEDMASVAAASAGGSVRLFPEYEGHCAPRPITTTYAAWWLTSILLPENDD